MNIIAPTLLGRRRSWQPSSTAHPATIYYHSKLTQLLPHANQFAGAASFTSSAPFFLSLETQLSNQVDKFFPVSEMRAQPSRASCLPRTKTDRRNLCEPRRYERRLPISEYHDLTLSRFSRYVASRGAREERVGAAGRSPELLPALFAQICPRACPSLPGLGTRKAGSESAFLQISHSLPCWWGWREYRGKSVRGRRWRPSPDIGPGDWTGSGRPGWPSSLAVPGM